MNRFHFIFALLIAFMPVITSCSGDKAEDIYAHERAFLKFSPVTGVVPLYRAVNSQGIFCTIKLGTSVFRFQSSDGATATYPYSADIQAYGQPQCIAGFVIGKSNIPDMNLQYPLVCYDLACPNCYEQSLITRDLTLDAQEQLTCSRCHRVYDLSNGGIIKQGDKGSRLYRYRNVGYSDSQGGLLVVMN